MKCYLNNRLARFLAIAVIAYGVWFVAYDLIIKPDGRLDEAAANSVATSAGEILKLFGLDASVNGRHVRLANFTGVEVVDGCNGLSALGLFAGFVFAYPGFWKRRMWFIPLGLFIVFLANVVRIGTLAYFQGVWPSAFDVIHNVGVSTFFYFIIFGLWLAWAKFGGSDKSEVILQA